VYEEEEERGNNANKRVEAEKRRSSPNEQAGKQTPRGSALVTQEQIRKMAIHMIRATRTATCDKRASMTLYVN
jgi:hypothetical protein